MSRKVSCSTCLREVKKYPETIEETDDLRKERSLPEVIEEEDDRLICLVFSVRCHEICVGQYIEIFLVNIGICIECCNQYVIRSSMKMIQNFLILFFGSCCDIGSFTNHLIFRKYVQSIVEVAKYSCKLLFKLFPDFHEMLFLSSFSIDSNS